MSRRGWTSRILYVGGMSISLFTDPDGQRWVRAAKREKPHKRLKCPHGLPPLPLRRFERSAAARRLRRDGVDLTTITGG